ncbi:hypothetical protein [Rhizobium sp. 11515TR]|uniref:hypothetical protein n=1 Tax=Rhizobium sp. 11515TR TaxID=2028343 RepID=UPI000BA889E4|nr:hypothetical protein [Rhizobium sp. 11515TR]ASW06297.1 hypothetical protein CKA34_10655 [Rhizobium sp. 11515TR]
MDKELRKEVRDWKVEMADEIAMLKQQVAALMASQGAESETLAPDAGKGKKTPSEPAVAETQ